MFCWSLSTHLHSNFSLFHNDPLRNRTYRHGYAWDTINIKYNTIKKKTIKQMNRTEHNIVDITMNWHALFISFDMKCLSLLYLICVWYNGGRFTNVPLLQRIKTDQKNLIWFNLQTHFFLLNWNKEKWILHIFWYVVLYSSAAHPYLKWSDCWVDG